MPGPDDAPQHRHRVAAAVAATPVRLGGAAVVAFAALPVLYVVALSLVGDPVSRGLWPPHVTLVNYRIVLDPSYGFLPALQNSLALSTGTTLVSLVVAAPGAYALGRLRVPGSRHLLAGMLALAFFPGIMILVPVRVTLSRLGLFDTLPGIGLAQLGFTVPLAVWFLSYAFGSVPRELEEAAMLDGAGLVRRLVRVVLPVAGPGVAATTAVVFLASWSDFLFSSGLSQSPSSRTLPVMLSQLPTIGFLGGQFAASVLMCLPVVLVLAAAVVWLDRRGDGSRPARRGLLRRPARGAVRG